VATNRQSTLIDAWHRIVENYTQRSFTVAADKLAAIAGLVTKFDNGIPGSPRVDLRGQHIAGLWRNNLVPDLTWTTEPRCTVAPQHDRAPSWSWAGWDGAVDWRLYGHVERDFATLCEVDFANLYISDTGLSAKQVSGRLYVTGLFVSVSQDGFKRRSWLADPTHAVPSPDIDNDVQWLDIAIEETLSRP
jgi:hypothetical protein